jgi:YHS domain-containing protein
LHAKGDQPVHSLTPNLTNARSKDQQELAKQQKGVKPLPKKAEEEADDHHYVMEGYCPVSIQEQGIWVRGSYQNLVKYEGRKYLLAGEKEKQLFLEDTQRYVPALGGDCIVSLTDDGKLVPGSVYHTLIFEGKLYLFAGSDQEQAFHAEPTNYVEPAAETEEAPQESEAPTDEEALSEQQNGQ